MRAFPKPSEMKLKRGDQKKGTEDHRKLRSAVYAKTQGVCYLCDKPIRFLTEMTIDHRVPRGMGGGTADHRMDNLWPTHKFCNSRKGSRRIAEGEICPECGHDVIVVGPECFKCGWKGK